jgi:hypothetical protein
MPEERSGAPAPSENLREALLGYLQAIGFPPWPGADGLTVHEVLRSYRHAAAAGRVPDREELVRRHAELDGAIQDFFASKKD